jgi:hypothetical protein
VAAIQKESGFRDAQGEGVAAESEGEKEAKRSNGIEQDLRLACFISLDQDLTVTTPCWT